MHVGLLTAAFDAEAWPLERIIPWAGAEGFDALEIHQKHLDAKALLKAKGQKALQQQLADAGVVISSLGYYRGDLWGPDPKVLKEQVEDVKTLLQAAESLEVDTVCTLAGMPLPEKSKADTIRAHLPDVFGPLLEEAKKRGVRLALENWFATNIQHLDHWKVLFETLPAPHFGLNFDPSHLDMMGIDYIGALYEFKDRIFHTHAKDVVVNESMLRRRGILDAERSWWRFSIPGTGRIDWGHYVSHLRQIGYDDVLSIEHEDNTLGQEDGFRLGCRHLQTVIA